LNEIIKNLIGLLPRADTISMVELKLFNLKHSSAIERYFLINFLRFVGDSS